MTMKRVIFLAVFLWSTSLPAPIIVGNGGDPRILIFRKARIEAVNWSYKISLHKDLIAEDRHLADSERRFIMGDGILEDWSKDILTSPHFFDLEERPTCAWTNDPTSELQPPSLDNIRLSLPTCSPYLKTEGRTYAIKTLIHESCHHMIRDTVIRETYEIEFRGSPKERYDQEEAFCDQVTLGIERTFLKVIEAGVPHWQDISTDHSLGQRGFHSAFWTGSSAQSEIAERMIIWGGCREDDDGIYGCSRYLGDGSLYHPATDSWRAMTNVGAPEPRIAHAATYVGHSIQSEIQNQMFVWGGCNTGDGCTNYLNTGGIYHVAKDEWTPIMHDSAPSPRAHHTVVFTGEKYIVWGGEFGANHSEVDARALGDGGIYDPTYESWVKISPPPPDVLVPRSYHAAIWTGDTGNPVSSHKMLVWGGCDFAEYAYCHHVYGDGAFYDPQTDMWSPLQATGTPPSPRRLFSANYALTQDSARLFIWGGQHFSRRYADGAILDLKKMSWRRIARPSPERRSRHTSVWANGGLIVFGGEVQQDQYVEDMGIYLDSVDAGTGRWRQPESEYYPLRVKNHTAVWTGDRMIIWGGQSDYRAFENVGAMFFPGDHL